MAPPNLGIGHGSKILKEMERQKLIRVNSRGITRRSVMDLDTGRPTSDWKDTVSREVEVLHPAFKEIRSLKKKIYMADRIGSTRPSSRVHIKLQQKKYYDARGKESQLRLITRDAFDRFPAEQIDNRMKNCSDSCKFCSVSSRQYLCGLHEWYLPL